jgi:hypothetical protein
MSKMPRELASSNETTDAFIKSEVRQLEHFEMFLSDCSQKIADFYAKKQQLGVLSKYIFWSNKPLIMKSFVTLHKKEREFDTYFRYVMAEALGNVTSLTLQADHLKVFIPLNISTNFFINHNNLDNCDTVMISG